MCTGDIGWEGVDSMGTSGGLFWVSYLDRTSVTLSSDLHLGGKTRGNSFRSRQNM